ncbi:hypothetical protein [Clostridium sp. M14]|uniref:hypothetical protein n=1 Tax=Clostridium sp. M14 TaxID=2716311 RepID=UPI0013EE7A3F|nr:hypothetical protein [Clostridium sp. M14]MBZ9690864.1 hypothetical protein [Clostridium sp. M14]
MKINVEFNSVEEMQDFAKLIGAPSNCNGIKVEIGAPTVEEAKKEDNSKGNEKNASKKTEKTKTEDKLKRNETPSTTENKEPVQDEKPEKVEAEVTGIDNTSSEPPKDVTEDVAKVTKEMLRDACAKVMKLGKQAEVKQIFKKYGANKLPELKEEDYTAAYKDVEALK